MIVGLIAIVYIVSRVRCRMKREHCEIEVRIPEDADVKKVESAVNEALKTKLTNAVVESCHEITITIRFGRAPS